MLFFLWEDDVVYFFCLQIYFILCFFWDKC